MICGLHNHDMRDKLADHPIACRLLSEEGNRFGHVIEYGIAQKHTCNFEM